MAKRPEWLDDFDTPAFSVVEGAVYVYESEYPDEGSIELAANEVWEYMQYRLVEAEDKAKTLELLIEHAKDDAVCLSYNEHYAWFCVSQPSYLMWTNPILRGRGSTPAEAIRKALGGGKDA